MADPFDLVLSPTAPLESGRYPGFAPKVEEYEAFVKHSDVAVPLRDGTTIYIDLFLPKDAGAAPSLVGWSPYGKHGLKNLGMMPGADVDADWVSPHVIWEGPDPAYWCPRGYAIVSPDPRGAWGSEGTLTFWSEIEADDGYDLVEWLAKQEWSNGKVGMLGVSYLAISQWKIAARRPPSLAAICPWEGVSDLYRELCYHGGIPERRFMNWWQPKSRFSQAPAEDMLAMLDKHPLRDAYWESKMPDLAAIEAPAYVVASWSDHGMHTRGTLEGFRQIGSKQKWLEVHGQKKWRNFYHPESVARQTAFFDHFLLGRETGLESWPKVRLELREDNQASEHRIATAWPDPDVGTERLFLDCAARTLGPQAPREQTSLSYDGADGTVVAFDYKVEQDMEIVGGGALHVWMAPEYHDEIDVFVALQKIDASGRVVGFRFYSTFSEGPLALGWLRASHRALAEGSTELVPVHSHIESVPLTPGEAVPLAIEIWPAGNILRRGETLRLLISGSDLYRFDTGAPEMGHVANNRGKVRILSGADRPSYLALPARPLQR